MAILWLVWPYWLTMRVYSGYLCAWNLFPVMEALAREREQLFLKDYCVRH